MQKFLFLIKYNKLCIQILLQPFKTKTMKKLLLFIFTFICLTANAKIAVKERSKIGIVSIDNPVVAENGGQGVFTITLSEASLTDTVIDFTLSGTASVNQDYSPFQSTTVVISAGDTSRTITVFIVDDLTIDGTKTVILNGTVTSGNAQNTTLSGTLTINDDDTGVVSVSTTTPFVAEPSATGLFFISMSNQSNTDTFITYTITGTATSGVDYTTIPLTLVIPAGATAVTLPVSVIDDLCVEAQETVIITLVSTSNTAISVNSATSTISINDNDSGAIVTVSATTPTASEQSGTSPGIFTFTIPCPQNTPTTITYTVTGTATNGIDYSNIPLSIIIPANATSVTLPIQVVDDTIIEGTEVVSITLVSTSNPIVAVNTTPATVAILDNDLGVISVVTTRARAT